MIRCDYFFFFSSHNNNNNGNNSSTNSNNNNYNNNNIIIIIIIMSYISIGFYSSLCAFILNIISNKYLSKESISPAT